MPRSQFTDAIIRNVHSAGLIYHYARFFDSIFPSRVTSVQLFLLLFVIEIVQRQVFQHVLGCVGKVQKSVDPLEQLPAKEKRAFPFVDGNGNGISPWRKFPSDRFPRCGRFHAIVSIDLTAGAAVSRAAFSFINVRTDP